MKDNDLAKEIAKGIIATGIEGAYDSVSCSTAGDYPSMGVSQWEGARGDELLSHLQEGHKFMSRRYSEIVAAGELPALKAILCSDEGKAAQRTKLSADCLEYVSALQKVPTLDDSRCVIYAGLWCPTSTAVVVAFLKKRYEYFNLRSLASLSGLFRSYYWIAADVGELYKRGYENRADTSFAYVKTLDLLQEYGVPAYGYYTL